MPSELDDNLRLEIGHVLFIDIVGYSKLFQCTLAERDPVAAERALVALGDGIC